MSEQSLSSLPLEQQHLANHSRGNNNECQDEAIIATADDAILAKLSCVQYGYYDDPFIYAMARGAAGLFKKCGAATASRRIGSCDNRQFHLGLGDRINRHHAIPVRHSNEHVRNQTGVRGGAVGFNERPRGVLPINNSSIEPIIRRGTHARICAVDRAIQAFLSLPLPSNENVGFGGGPNENLTLKRNITRQIVILGAGRDTTYLRHRFGYLQNPAKLDQGHGGVQNENGDGSSSSSGLLNKHGVEKEEVEGSVNWFEVDHPSVMQQKSQLWLPACVPGEYSYRCEQAVTSPSSSPQASLSFSVSISPKSSNDNNSNNRSSDVLIDAEHRILLEGECNSSNLGMASNYHLIGHDLRSPPSALFEILTHHHGYDRSIPTLFVLECVAMYLPNETTWDLFRYLAGSIAAPISPLHNSDPTSRKTNPFIGIVLYDPILCDDRFGQVMLQNLHKRGIVGQRARSHIGIESSQTSLTGPELSLEKTISLSDQLTKLTSSGFDVAVGCNMMDAYDQGIVSVEERQRAARCELLDELEEFSLLMSHYCLVVGVHSVSSTHSTDIAQSTQKRNLMNQSVGYDLCSLGEDSLIGFKEGYCSVAFK